jgi:hypothetical protein
VKRSLAACLLLAAGVPVASDDHSALAAQAVATFSIVAIDPVNGDLGVAVASRQMKPCVEGARGGARIERRTLRCYFRSVLSCSP